MPHVEILKGISIDLKKETQGKDWILDVVPSVFKKFKNKENEMIDRLIQNVGFMSLFKRDFENLPNNKKNVLKKKLPKKFWVKYDMYKGK